MAHLLVIYCLKRFAMHTNLAIIDLTRSTPTTVGIDDQQSPLRRIHDAILRFRLRFGLVSVIEDLEVLEGGILRIP